MSDISDPRPRRLRFAIIVAAAVLVMVGGPIGAFVFLTYIPDTSQPMTVSDARKIVAIDLPAGWFDDTRNDAGQISTKGDSGDATEPYRVPDLEASKNLLDFEGSPVCAFDVTIGSPERGTPHQAQHTEQVKVARDDYEATSQLETTSTTISGYPALSTTLWFRDLPYVVSVITVITDDYVITMNGYNDLPDDPAGRDLQQLLAHARIASGPR